jgi:hypothetical protein
MYENATFCQVDLELGERYGVTIGVIFAKSAV